MNKKRLQLNLKNEDASPWEGICSVQCWTAKGKKCECKCGGIHHGTGLRTQEENKLKKYYPSAQKYRQFITRSMCRREPRHPEENIDLSQEIIWAYPHEDGWEIEETDELQWLYIICPVCGYEWSIWKLGVSRIQTIRGEKQ